VAVSTTHYGSLVAIAGELDIATVPRLRDALASEAVVRAHVVVVDLTGVTFMDSTGLSVLVTFQADADARRQGLAIACPEGAARLLLDVTGVAERMPLYPSRELAEAALG
jgi:anti-sigma B factor antagonist